MFQTRILKKTIGNIETFIENNQTHYRKMFNLYNATRMNKLLHHSTHQAVDPSAATPEPNILEKNQIETRILKILWEGDFVDVREFQFKHDLRKDWNLDELSITALISSIEEEFSTIFDIHVYEDVRNLIDVVQLLQEDEKIV